MMVLAHDSDMSTGNDGFNFLAGAKIEVIDRELGSELNRNCCRCYVGRNFIDVI